MTDPRPLAAEYFLEVESHFAFRRGTPFILSAKDWLLMKKWYDDGVPLSVVIESIDTVYIRNEASGRRKVISSLSYCKHAVKELWEERKDLQVGAHDSTQDLPANQILDALASDVAATAAHAPDSLQIVLEEAAASIRGLAAEKSAVAIEQRLLDLEQSVIDRLVSRLPASELERINAEITAALASGGRIDAATRRRTEEANLRRLVRQLVQLPRLTLLR